MAAGLPVSLAWLCRIEYPIYVLIASVIVTDLSPAPTRKLGLQGLLSTVVGATCGSSFGQALQRSAWVIGFGVLVAMLIRG